MCCSQGSNSSWPKQKILWKKGAFEKKEPLEKRLVNLWKKDFKHRNSLEKRSWQPLEKRPWSRG
jgi:hypothetical protein